MRYHQNRHRRTAQHVLEPFYHLQIQMVGRLVKDEQVWFACQHSRKRDALHLSTTQLCFRSCGFLFRDFHLGEESLVPLQVFIVLSLQFQCLNGGCLFQIAHFQVIAEDHRTPIVTFFSCDDAE